MSIIRYLKSHHTGYGELLSGSYDWLTQPIAAVLVMNAHIPDREMDITYADIIDNICPYADYTPQDVVNKSIVLQTSGNIRYSHDLLDFCLNTIDGKGTVSARYIYYILGEYDNLQGTDVILGHLDLTGDADYVVEDAYFKFRPNTGGLWDIYPTQPVIV